MNKSVTLEIEGVGQVLFERSIKAKHLNISVKPFKGKLDNDIKQRLTI